MKKYFWLAAMAVTVSMASCSLEEVVEQPAPQAIGFSSFVGKPTKAVTQTDEDVLKGADVGFKVWGGYASDNDKSKIFDGRKVTWSSSAWEYTDIEYWVPNQTYKFAAVGPAGVIQSVDDTTDDSSNPAGTNASFAYDGGHLSFDYSLIDLTQSVDVVYAEKTTENTGDNSASAPEKVELTFGHIMSWIKIEFVHAMTDDYQITVSDVKVEGVKTNATFTGSNTSTGTWDAPDTEAYLGSNESSTVNPDTYSNGASSAPLDAEGESCMVDFIAIPQTITYSTGQTPSAFKISFKLKVQDSEGTYLLGSGDAAKDFSTTLTKDQTWAVNNVYIYRAYLTPDVLDLKPIKFNVSNFEGWNSTETVYDNDTDNSNNGSTNDFTITNP